MPMLNVEAGRSVQNVVRFFLRNRWGLIGEKGKKKKSLLFFNQVSFFFFPETINRSEAQPLDEEASGNK